MVPRVFPMAEKPFSLSFNNVVQFTDRIAISIFVYEQKNIFVHQNTCFGIYSYNLSQTYGCRVSLISSEIDICNKLR